MYLYVFQKLISVNLSGLKSLSAKALAEFVKTFPALKALNLEKTKCNDQVLAILGRYSMIMTLRKMYLLQVLT